MEQVHLSLSWAAWDMLTWAIAFAQLRQIVFPLRLIWMILEETAWAQKFLRIFPFLSPISDEEAARNLARALKEQKEQQQKKEEKDGSIVLTLKNAMAAVDKHVGAGEQLLNLLKSIGSALSGSAANTLTRLHASIRDEMLKSAMRQDRPRIRKTRKGYFRPGARRH